MHLHFCKPKSCMQHPILLLNPCFAYWMHPRIFPIREELSLWFGTVTTCGCLYMVHRMRLLRWTSHWQTLLLGRRCGVGTRGWRCTPVCCWHLGEGEQGIWEVRRSGRCITWGAHLPEVCPWCLVVTAGDSRLLEEDAKRRLELPMCRLQ